MVTGGCRGVLLAVLQGGVRGVGTETGGDGRDRGAGPQRQGGWMTLRT